jgi:hypothetical protein
MAVVVMIVAQSGASTAEIAAGLLSQFVAPLAVIAGLDPAIHQEKLLPKQDGCAGPGYAKASPGLSPLGTPKL